VETDPLRPHMATPRVAAGALFTDKHDRVLLVQPAYKDHWDIPGGYVEPGESPLRACIREIGEELGITPPIGGLLVVDWAPADAEGDKLLFIFDGGQIAPDYLAAIHLDPTELAAHAFHDLTTATPLLIPRLARRLTAALDAHHSDHPRYLEHGTPTTPLPS
jgi:8-oxo-dGTP pyrophosphatase MutT (NUDIX family)